jgi:3-oxoacyl-[acyl-carrier protein] reductase
MALSAGPAAGDLCSDQQNRFAGGWQIIRKRERAIFASPSANPKRRNTMTDSNRIALVTGASRGIGAAIARRLASDGYTVVINYAGSAAPAEELAAEIEEASGKARTIQADVSDPTAVARMFESAEAAFGGVDVLVNNAGIMKLATLADGDDVLIESQIAINLKGTINTLREAARRLRDGGRIVNLSTSVVGLKLETYGVYAATKAAVETLTGILAKELRGRGVTVNAVAPGPTATALFLDGKSPELIERMSNMNPLERLGTPDDIAAAVGFLVGPDGGWINGQVLRANGGMI